jgi:hypothetical protein
MELYDWQKDSAEALLASLREHHVAADWSDTGTGKTAKAVWVAKQLGKPVAIICPKAVIPAWRNWCKEAGIEPTFILNYEKLRAGSTPYGDFVGGAWVWSQPIVYDQLFIWDEVHKCKGPNSLNGKMLIASRPYYTLMLSATFASNPLDMKATGYVLGLHKYADFWPWCIKNGVKKAPWGAMSYFGGKKSLAVIHQAMAPKSSRVKIRELGDKFPDNEVFAEAYDCGDVQGLYDDLERRLAELEVSKAADKPHPMTEILRARQESELLRVPILADLTDSLLDEGRSVVIFCNFRNSLDALLSLFSKSGSMIWGGQSTEEREEMISDFQSDKTNVMLCQVQSGGVGVSLHDENGVRPRSSLICPTYSAIDLKQALGRIHRAGAKSKAVQKIIFAAGSIEEQVMKKVRAKLKNIETLNDGDIETI